MAGRVAALMVNWNGGRALIDSLASLPAAGIAPEDVLLVDNASSDESHREAARLFPALTLLETGAGISFAAANNLGLRHLAVRGAPEAVLFVNNDAVLDPGCVGTLAAALERDQTLAAAVPFIRDAGGRVWYAGGRADWKEAGGRLTGQGEADRAEFHQAARVSFAPLCVLLVRWSALEKVGLLDETYRFYDEDLEWCLRCTRAGLGIAYEPAAGVTHLVGHSTAARGPAFVYRNMARNRILTMRRYGTPLRWAAFLPWFGAMMAWKAARFALQGDPATAGAILGGIGEGCRDKPAAVSPSPTPPLKGGAPDLICSSPLRGEAGGGEPGAASPSPQHPSPPPSPPRGEGVKMRVLFVHQGAELYGSDRVLLNLAGFLAGRGHSVLVILPEEGPLVAALWEVGAAAIILTFPVIRRREFRGAGAARFFIRLLRARATFDAAVRDFAPDVVCSNTGTVLNGALWARRARRPHVWLVHEIYRGGRGGRRLFGGVIGRLADRVVVPSRAVADGLGLDGKSLVIPNGIRPDDYAGREGTLRLHQGLIGDEILVGTVGRFNSWKGQREMVPAMTGAALGNERLRFVFAGAPFRGDEAILDDFLARVREAGLEELVIMLGEVPDTREIYPDLDLLVLPSVEPEPFGLVLLEAMAAGLPVVAFDQGGPREIIDPSCGILVPPGDHEGLARAILALAADPARRRAMGEAGARRVRDAFTVEVQGGRFEELLREVIVARESA